MVSGSVSQWEYNTSNISLNEENSWECERALIHMTSSVGYQQLNMIERGLIVNILRMNILPAYKQKSTPATPAQSLASITLSTWRSVQTSRSWSYEYVVLECNSEHYNNFFYSARKKMNCKTWEIEVFFLVGGLILTDRWVWMKL